MYLGFSVVSDDGSFAISTIRVDQRYKCLSKTFQSLCISNDIRQEFLSVGGPVEIGLFGRHNRTLLENV